MPDRSRLRGFKHSCHFPATWSRSASVAIELEVGKMSPARRCRRCE